MQLQKTVIVCTISIAVLFSSSAHTKLYKWVDKNGKIHYSDKPSTKENVTKKEISLKKSSENKSYNVKQVKTNTPVSTFGQPNRSARLESILLKNNNSSGKKNTIFYGQKCKNSTTLFTNNDHLINSEQSPSSYNKFSNRFSSKLIEAGYSAEKTEDILFRGQQSKSAELSFAAIISDMRINGCDHFTDTHAKYSSYIKVEWKVFDNLTREIVLEKSSEGSYSGMFKYGIPRQNLAPNNWKIALEHAFASATTNLLAKQSVADLLTDIEPQQALAENTALKLPIKIGDQKKQFLDELSSLKSSSVTIRSTQGHGSGFIITTEGHILTNSHVVQGADRVVVLLENEKLDATVIRRDTKRDVALIKLTQTRTVSPANISTQKLTEGENIYVIGTPLKEDLGHSITRGIISAKRKLEDGQPYLQTDAAINPGNSGGPVFNDAGEIVALAVSGYFSQTGGSLNINFLIPIDSALEALNINQ